MMKQHGITSRQERGWYIFIEKLSEANYKLTAVHEKVVMVIEDAESEEMAETFSALLKFDELARAAKE